jgi:hypothetical protein
MLSGIIQEDAAAWIAFPQLLELSRAVKGITTVPEPASNGRPRPVLQEVFDGDDFAER